jgi:hypothetical protein
MAGGPCILEKKELAMRKLILSAILTLSVLLVGLVWWSMRSTDLGPLWESGGTETITWTEYRPPQPEAKPLLVDDRLEDKATTFDPELVDRRPEGDWLVNLSDAVIRLDAPTVKPDVEPDLLVLHRSYAEAHAGTRSARSGLDVILPSVNMVDGKAKQFDDGLVAALAQASLLGKSSRLPNHVAVVRRLLAKVGPDSPAAPFLAAGLGLVGGTAQLPPDAEKEKATWLRAFKANEVLSKPIGVYTWTKTLSDAYRFHHFFQQTFDRRDLTIPQAIAQALQEDQELLVDYQRAVAFDSGLTNPPECLVVTDLLDASRTPAPGQGVALFPPSTTPEGELFAKLFPDGLPPGADLMRALIERIRSGAVDLTPKKSSGWYDHQVYALETLLLPEKGDESRKLLLTKSYKLRMLEAFKALMTKRRETHALAVKAAGALPLPPAEVKPRLRVEPCPSYYLRTARAYAFLAAFLESAVGEDVLTTLHGLREEGERAPNLRDELASMRDLFYGVALLSAEDIGMRLAFHDDEPVDRDRCERLAREWLARALQDPDLAVDTRVSIPIYADPARKITRLWATLGVRLTRLEASFARPPRIKPKEGEGSEDWKAVERTTLGTSYYLIAVDEFAEVELRGNRALTRKELRTVCDQQKTKEAIVSALER